MTPKKPLLLDEDEIKRLSGALASAHVEISPIVPQVGSTMTAQFVFIAWMLERVRAGDGYGIDLTLLGRDSAKQTGVQYTAMGYTREGVPCIDTVITNRGPAVAVALAIILTSEEAP
jgi:hypothetical protein